MKTFFAFIGALVSVFLIALLFNYPVMWGLNYLLTSSTLLAVFGVAKLTFRRTYLFTAIVRYLFQSNS